MIEIEKKLIEKFGTRRESITDIGEALNLLSVYGEECELCIHQSIREKAYNQFKDQKNEFIKKSNI